MATRQPSLAPADFYNTGPGRPRRVSPATEAPAEPGRAPTRDERAEMFRNTPAVPGPAPAIAAAKPKAKPKAKPSSKPTSTRATRSSSSSSSSSDASGAAGGNTSRTTTVDASRPPRADASRRARADASRPAAADASRRTSRDASAPVTPDASRDAAADGSAPRSYAVEGSGALLALILYPLVANLLTGGPARMWGWVRAKFINEPYSPGGPGPSAGSKPAAGVTEMPWGWVGPGGLPPKSLVARPQMPAPRNTG